MVSIDRPRTVTAAFSEQPSEGGSYAWIRPIPQSSNHPEPDQEVVVVVNGEVYPVPRQVRPPTLGHQSAAQIEFGSPGDGLLHRLRARTLRDLCEGGESLPTVQRARPPTGKTVPASVGLLVSNDPADASLDHRMIEVTVADECPRAVPRTTDLAVGPPQEVGTSLGPTTHDQLRGATDPGIGPRHSEIGQEQEAPVRRVVLRPVDLLVRRPGSDPMSVGELMGENPFGPPSASDRPARRADPRVAGRPALHFRQKPPADTRVGRASRKPLPDSGGEAHGFLKTSPTA
jgi:hypothetical protein